MLPFNKVPTKSLYKKEDFEEIRDYELTRLRLWEEYQVKRIETEYNEDISKAKQNQDRMIKLIKEKLYDKLEKQIKQLKDDKLLLNLVNANSWKGTDKGLNGSLASHLNAAQISISLHERRSLRKREVLLRFTAGEADDLSDDGRLSGRDSIGSLGNGYFSSNNNGSNSNNNGYSSSSKRRRHYATRYSSNEESSGSKHQNGSNNGGGGGNTSGGYSSHQNGHNSYQQNTGVSSGNDSNLSDKDYDTLNSIIMGNEDGGVSLVLLENQNGNTGEPANNRPNTRGSHKQFSGLSGLKPEELNDDLMLLRNAIKKDK